MLKELKEFAVSLFQTGEVVVESGTKMLVSKGIIEKCEKEYGRAEKGLFAFIDEIAKKTVSVEDDEAALAVLKGKVDAADEDYRAAIQKCKGNAAYEEVAVRKLRIVKMYEASYARKKTALAARQQEVADAETLIDIGRVNLDTYRAELDGLVVQYETQCAAENTSKVMLDWNTTKYLGELRNIVRVRDAAEELKKKVGLEGETAETYGRPKASAAAQVKDDELAAQVKADIAALQ